MTTFSQRPAHKLWRNWKRIAFTSQMIWNKKKHSAVIAPEYDPEQEENVVLLSQQKSLPDIPKKVWMYWHGEQLPKSMKLNIKKLRQDNADHEINLITQRTLSQWLPDLNFISSDLTLAHKSDIIRLELLQRYGGIGIDCSTLLFENLSWVHKVHQERPMDVIGYYRERSTINYLSPVTESWFLAAAPQNPFIREWLKQLAPVKNIGIQNYVQELKKRDDFPLILQNIDNPSRQLLSLAQQVAIREYRRINFYLRKGEANAYYYQGLHADNSDAFARSVLFQQRPQTPPPIIKLTGNERLHLDFNLHLGLYNRTSLIGEMMHSASPVPLALPSAINKTRA
ncbi:MAG: capsular polysaccharide synthesis protein [Enterobacterales bacterium endosymbiont of Blomia tropicalis]|uniref:glycosyltransferase family 32 protein n=1 Tax=Mixta mediterraneensis TaxID=2758443 RepID=UPI0025A7DBDC|nr:capsular polysaccharide synthesis protein [Mixta mediterraneensis]MDL4915469.1 capsular polysaccharide synthesis protein [Mixta mediterraneensis]